MSFMLGKQTINEEQQIVCPTCGEADTHLAGYAPYYNEGRLCLNLIFDCEHGHVFSLCVDQHAGVTTLRPKYKDDWLTQNND